LQDSELALFFHSVVKTLHPRLIFCLSPLPGITSCIFTCIWLLQFIYLHHPLLLPYAFLASPLAKPQWFLRQSYPSAQMTLLHHLALCRLPSLQFPCSGSSFSLLPNIFHNLAALYLGSSIISVNPSRLPLHRYAVTPTTHQLHLSIASRHVLSRR
jgi:hypothetical protein